MFTLVPNFPQGELLRPYIIKDLEESSSSTTNSWILLQNEDSLAVAVDSIKIPQSIQNTIWMPMTRSNPYQNWLNRVYAIFSYFIDQTIKVKPEYHDDCIDAFRVFSYSVDLNVLNNILSNLDAFKTFNKYPDSYKQDALKVVSQNFTDDYLLHSQEEVNDDIVKIKLKITILRINLFVNLFKLSMGEIYSRQYKRSVSHMCEKLGFKERIASTIVDYSVQSSLFE